VTELDNGRRYYLRLTERFYFYDTTTHHSREWAEGAAVADPAEMEWLSKIGAPVEQIEQSEHGDSQ
jgi:hypothetical protein